jgi:hypothetical protein
MNRRRAGGPRSTTNSMRRTAGAAGTLLVIATGAALAAAELDPTLTGTDWLNTVGEHPDRLAVAALLYLVAAGTSVGIALALYPVLKTVDTALALGSVVFRTIEAVFYVAAVVSLLSILPLGRQLTAASADSSAVIHEMADSLLNMRDHSTLAGGLAFCVSALLYYVLLYRARLVPRWLSTWGLAGALVMMSACLLALFRGNPVTGYTFLILPIAVQEMVLALWLLARGFNPSPRTSSPAADSSAAVNAMTVQLH